MRNTLQQPREEGTHAPGSGHKATFWCFTSFSSRTALSHKDQTSAYNTRELKWADCVFLLQGLCS